MKRVLIAEAVEDGDNINLFSVDGILYDSDSGAVIHDFSIGPIVYNKFSGSFTVNYGEEPIQEETSM